MKRNKAPAKPARKAPRAKARRAAGPAQRATGADEGAPLSDEERERFDAIMGRLKHLETIVAHLHQLAADSPEGAGRQLLAEIVEWPQGQWNALARAIGAGRACTVTKRQTQPGKSGMRAEIAHGFGHALALLRDDETSDRVLPSPVRRYLLDLVGVGYLRVDIHRVPGEVWIPGAASIVDAALDGAFSDPDPETNVHAAGPVAAGVGCAARLFGVSARTIWEDRKGALLAPAESLAFQIALRYGDGAS